VCCNARGAAGMPTLFLARLCRRFDLLSIKGKKRGCDEEGGSWRVSDDASYIPYLTTCITPGFELLSASRLDGKASTLLARECSIGNMKPLYYDQLTLFATLQCQNPAAHVNFYNPLPVAILDDIRSSISPTFQVNRADGESGRA